MTSPWTCPHRCHSHCLQLRGQHCSTTSCPSCDENFTRQFLPSTSRNPSMSNMNYQQSNHMLEWREVHCPCGFWGSVHWFGEVATLCPSCHRPLQSTMVRPSFPEIRYEPLPAGLNNVGCVKTNAECTASRGASPSGMDVQAPFSDVEDEYGMPLPGNSTQSISGPVRLVPFSYFMCCNSTT